MIGDIQNVTPPSGSEILYGSENAVDKVIRFMQNTKIKMDVIFGHKAPSIVAKVPEYSKCYKDILSRGENLDA